MGTCLRCSSATPGWSTIPRSFLSMPRRYLPVVRALYASQGERRKRANRYKMLNNQLMGILSQNLRRRGDFIDCLKSLCERLGRMSPRNEEHGQKSPSQIQEG